MNVAFLTSGLETGQNGVGDYTALLSDACERRGRGVARLALNDRLVTRAEMSPGQFRLPSSLPWVERARAARGWIEAFAPDYVSLQFVCYGFHPRGFVGVVAKHLRKILAGFPLHVFFHELWIGSERGAPWKDRVLGFLQRRGVMGVLRGMDVRVVHTSNAAYVQRLRAAGVLARHLPLFGSLPLPQAQSSRTDGALTFAFFGTLHPVWPPEPLFTYLEELQASITVAHAGRIGTGLALWDRLEREYGGRFTFRRHGELPPDKIAEFLASADFGVATTPWEIVGKSASVAAMLDCGLPVVVNRDDVHYPGLSASDSSDPLLIKVGPDLKGKLASARKQAPRLRLPDVVEQFLGDCEAAVKI